MITVLKKEGGGPARYDHDHRFNGFFFDPFPNSVSVMHYVSHIKCWVKKISLKEENYSEKLLYEQLQFGEPSQWCICGSGPKDTKKIVINMLFNRPGVAGAVL